MASSDKEIDRAVEILRSGGLVAFATETVYGLGADATRADAIEKIYRAKGRPSTNPLIVHVADVSSARRCASAWPDAAQTLAERFWPGPLTLVVPKASSIADAATAGLDSVGLRSPNHPLALELLKRFDGPIAAPSANRSNRVSPTTAEHVRQELGDAVDLVLDGGPCQVGIESTVLSLVDQPTILRPGGVSQQQVEQVIGPVKLSNNVLSPSQAAASPGQHAVHYSPITPTFRFDSADRNKLDASHRDIVLAITPASATDEQMPADPAEYARRLYASLREADARGFSRILIEMPPASPKWQAVRDRLMRAARPV